MPFTLEQVLRHPDPVVIEPIGRYREDRFDLADLSFPDYDGVDVTEVYPTVSHAFSVDLYRSYPNDYLEELEEAIWLREDLPIVHAMSYHSPVLDDAEYKLIQRVRQERAAEYFKAAQAADLDDAPFWHPVIDKLPTLLELVQSDMEEIEF